jgi:hypothetical protein
MQLAAIFQQKLGKIAFEIALLRPFAGTAFCGEGIDNAKSDIVTGTVELATRISETDD